MHLRKLLMLLALSSVILSCEKAPRLPDIKECGPIIYFNEDGAPDLSKSYAFCVLRKDPYNEDFHERLSLQEFLLDKPRMIRAEDAIKLDLYERDLIRWGAKHCSLK